MTANSSSTGPTRDDARPDLTFPCPWTYTVIGSDEARLRAAVHSTVGPIAYRLEFSHSSKTGKYQSFQLEVVVNDDFERLRIFRELNAHPDVSYTL